MYISLTARYCCCLYFRFRACVRRNYTSIWYTLCVVYLIYISDDSYFKINRLAVFGLRAKSSAFGCRPGNFLNKHSRWASRIIC